MIMCDVIFVKICKERKFIIVMNMKPMVRKDFLYTNNGIFIWSAGKL